MPILYAVVYTDADGKIRIADSSSYISAARRIAKVWRRWERAGREYRIVRYEPAKARGRKR